jgi:Kef-type K+ transport system membrane component KefB
MSSLELAVRLFTQLTVILATCRVVGWLGRRYLGQTQVVMEMVAGVILGPSLLGLVAPGAQAWLFPRQLALDTGTVLPHPSMSILYALAQLGLVLYMFVIGLELDPRLLRQRARSAGIISAAGVLAPFLLGALLAVPLHARGGLFGTATPVATAALFLGASMSITAFPMLARILHERGLDRTPLGTITLAAGSIDDAVAWCLLALVLATQGSAPSAALVPIGGGLLYVAVMLLWARPRLARLARGLEPGKPLSDDRFTLALLVLLLGAAITDAIGIYAVFGAFVAGAAMPRGRFAELLTERLQGLTTTLLLPVFFAYSGLNTRIGLVRGAALWGIALLVIVLASLGKGVACALAARWSGESWRDAAVVGTLMNARGLMELILLNIGLEHGIITPTLFAVLVLMAIATTLATSPIYDRLVVPS